MKNETKKNATRKSRKAIQAEREQNSPQESTPHNHARRLQTIKWHEETEPKAGMRGKTADQSSQAEKSGVARRQEKRNDSTWHSEFTGITYVLKDFERIQRQFGNKNKTYGTRQALEDGKFFRIR